MHPIILTIFLEPVRKEQKYEGKNKYKVKEDRIMYIPRLQLNLEKTKNLKKE